MFTRILTYSLKHFPPLYFTGCPNWCFSFSIAETERTCGTRNGGDELKLGVRHYINSALPSQNGNIYIAGHRDSLFVILQYLKMDESIAFSTINGKFAYIVTGFQIVSPHETQVLKLTAYDTLTLQTCYPFSFFGFAPKRYIVHTKLVKKNRL